MKKILGLFVALSLLSGCAAIQKARQVTENVIEAVVNPDTVENVMIAYNAAQKTGLAYGRSCKARLLPESCWNIVNDLKPYEANATRAVLALDDYSRQFPTSDPTSLIQAAKRAIQAYKDTQFINGVK